MPAVQLKRQETVLQSLISNTVAVTDLSDVTDSSSWLGVFQAIAREFDEVYFQLTRMSDLFSIDTAAGDDLDERARDIQPGTITRIQPRRSIGNVVFSRQSTSGTVIIPAGTLIKTADGVTVKTTAQAKIEPTSPTVITGHATGRDASPVAATAVSPGSSGNVASGTLVKFGSKPSGVDAVTNLTAFTQGRDKETDDEFRARLKAYIASLARATVDALEFASSGIEDTTSGKQAVYTHVEEDAVYPGLVRLYVDDGNGTAESTDTATGEVVIASALGGEEFLYTENKPIKSESTITVTSGGPVGVARGALTVATTGSGLTADVYVNPASGLLYFSPALVATEEITIDYTYFTELIATVQRVIDGDPADRVNYPGYRAAGILVRVLSPRVVAQPVEAVLTYTDGADKASVISAAEDAVTLYINTLGISGDVIRSELIQRIMDVPGVYDVEIVEPASNVTILDDEVARVSSGLLSIS